MIHADTVCGICSVVSTNANNIALPMMNISIAVTFALSAITRGTSRSLTSRYTNTAITNAYTADTAAASVGVNTPSRCRRG